MQGSIMVDESPNEGMVGKDTSYISSNHTKKKRYQIIININHK